MRILYITSEWPNALHPIAVPFIVSQVEYLQKAGLFIDVFNFYGNKNIFKYIASWLKVQIKISRNGYDLIHAQWGQSGLLAIFPKRLPLVVTFRGDDIGGIHDKNGKNTLAGWVLQNVSKLVAKYADEVIIVSSHMSKFLPKREFHVIPSGIDLERFKPINRMEARKKLNLSQELPIIFFGGNPDIPNKRYNLAFKAYDLLKKDLPSLKLIIAKNIPHSDIPIYLNACNVLLLTSLHEGSPNIIKEALACNMPIVSTDAGDVRERIKNINGCILCENDMPETIAKSLLEVLSSSPIVNGRDSVLRFEYEKLNREVIDIYQKLASVESIRKTIK